MRRNGRPIDPHFKPYEKLFRRYKREHFIGGNFSNMGLSLKHAPSVNREKYSAREDVLYSETGEFTGWGVFSFAVEQIPSPLPEVLPEYSFMPIHAPREHNYGHSEIRCNRLQVTGNHEEPRPEVRKLFRTVLSQRVVIETDAQV